MQLVLILEYAPGVELFDAILSKTSFSEDEARPVFVQVRYPRGRKEHEWPSQLCRLDRPAVSSRGVKDTHCLSTCDRL